MKKIFSFIAGVAAAMTLQAASYTEAVQITMSGTGGTESQKLTLIVDQDQATVATNPNIASTYEVGQVNIYVANGSYKYDEYVANAISNLPLTIVTNRRDASYTFTFNVPISTEGLVLTDLRSDEGIKNIPMTHNGTYTFSVAGEANYAANTNITIADRFVINYVAPAPDYGSYQRNVTVGNYGTICLPKAGTIAGGTLFNIGSYENDMIYIDEVGSVEMEAGKPYIFQASAAQINVTYSSDVEVAAGEDNGLHGYFDADNYFVVPADAGNYILRSNQYWEVVSGQHVAYLNNYFAFIKISEINNQAPAPGRRRVGMAVNGAQVVTGIDELNAAEAPVKKFIDGKMYIIRGEHMFDATGRMVK